MDDQDWRPPLFLLLSGEGRTCLEWREQKGAWRKVVRRVDLSEERKKCCYITETLQSRKHESMTGHHLDNGTCSSNNIWVSESKDLGSDLWDHDRFHGSRDERQEPGLVGKKKKDTRSRSIREEPNLSQCRRGEDFFERLQYNPFYLSLAPCCRS